MRCRWLLNQANGYKKGNEVSHGEKRLSSVGDSVQPRGTNNDRNDDQRLVDGRLGGC